MGDQPFKVYIGDRIAQIIFERYGERLELKEVEELDQTERGRDGFGSSNPIGEPTGEVRIC